MPHGNFDEYEVSSRNLRAAQTHGFLQALVRENHEALIVFLRRRVGCREEADDIAHDLYCQIATLDDPNSIERPRAYLFRAARNFLLNRNRRRHFINANGHFSIEDAAEADIVSIAPSPEDAAASRQELAIVEQAIGELSPKCRMAFVLVRFEGCTYKQAAGRMGLSAKSIDYYMRQAMTHIRSRLDEATAAPAGREASRKAAAK